MHRRSHWRLCILAERLTRNNGLNSLLYAFIEGTITQKRRFVTLNGLSGAVTTPDTPLRGI